MSQLGRSLRWLRNHALEYSGLNRYSRSHLDGTCAAVILYHRVLPAEAADRLGVEPGMYVTPETFRRNLEWLCEDFRVLPLHEVVSRLESGRKLPRRACALSFDDGWRDNHDHALPVLEGLGATATVFLVANRVGTEGAFWPDEICRRMHNLCAGERDRVAASIGASGRGDPVGAILDVLKSLPEHERSNVLEQIRATTTPLPPAA